MSIDKDLSFFSGFCFIEFSSESIVDRIVKTKYHEVAGRRVMIDNTDFIINTAQHN